MYELTYPWITEAEANLRFPTLLACQNEAANVMDKAETAKCEYDPKTIVIYKYLDERKVKVGHFNIFGRFIRT